MVASAPLATDATANPQRGSYWITTFGCQMNKADSERMAGILEAMGYREASAELDADLVLYNTCTIRDNAEQKVYSYLGRQAQRKRSNPNLTLVVAGCVAQQEGESLLRRVPELDLVMGPQHANRLETLLLQVDSGQQVVATEDHHILEDITTARRDSSICGWVNVIYGCNERCTYCVVPSVRGKEQSRLPQAIKLEMEGLAAQGYKEITLLGQNIDAYGRDLPGITPEGRRQHTLTDLLHHVHDVEGIERIRFATSHPRYFTERLIDACADLPKLCEHFHIPFQSGDNDVLQAMARGYTVERYRRIIDRIRERMPDASLSADVIVAFPGETDAQYRRTLDLIEEIGFDQVNTAAYSPRPNTPAAHWGQPAAGGGEGGTPARNQCPGGTLRPQGQCPLRGAHGRSAGGGHQPQGPIAADGANPHQSPDLLQLHRSGWSCLRSGRSRAGAHRCGALLFTQRQPPAPLSTTLIPLALPPLRGRRIHAVQSHHGRARLWRPLWRTRRIDPIRGDRRSRTAQRKQHGALLRSDDLYRP